jgi:protein O-mannosyl-transferase
MDCRGRLQYHVLMRPKQPVAAPAANRDTLAVLALLLLALVPYLNTLTAGFVYDDRQQILENPYVHSFQYIGKIFGSTVWTFQGAQGLSNYYRPLMTLAYLLCYKLWGPIPFGFHLLNLALYAAVVLLVFAVTRRLFGDSLPALLTAGLFALHPIHTESVAWIAAITDLELSVFFLLTFLLYLRLGDRPAVTPFRLTGVLAAYALALLSKEQALVLPFLAAAYEHFYRPERDAIPFKQKQSRYLPLFALAAAYFCFRAFVLGGFAPSVSRPELGLSAILFSALALLGQYLWKLIWPLDLSAFYVFHPSQRLGEPQVLAGLAAVIVCASLFVWLWRRDRTASFGLLWMGATIAPVLNARWMPAGVFAERYLYLPSVGFCWLLSWVAAKAWRAGLADRSRTGARLLRQAAPIVVGLVAVLYGVRTVHRNRDWHSDEILYTKTLTQQPDAQIIRTNLGALYFDRGDLASAEREWLASLGPARPYASTLNNLGLLRSRQKRYDEAIAYFQRAIAERPNYMSPHKNLAETYADMGRPQDAEREYRAAIDLAPLSSGARNAFAQYLLDRGRAAEAREQYAISAQVDPNSEAQVNLGNFLAAAGEVDRARSAYQSAVAMDPFDSRAHFGLAKLDEAAGRFQEALSGYRAGLETDPGNAQAREAVMRLSGKTVAPPSVP